MTQRQFLTLLYFIGLLTVGYLIVGLIFWITWMIALSIGLLVSMFVLVIIRHPPSKNESSSSSE